MNRNPERQQAIQEAAGAILDGKDPEQHLARVLCRQERAVAISVAKAITMMPVWHAENIAKMATVHQRRQAIDRLPKQTQPAVKRRLAALWRAKTAKAKQPQGQQQQAAPAAPE